MSSEFKDAAAKAISAIIFVAKLTNGTGLIFSKFLGTTIVSPASGYNWVEKILFLIYAVSPLALIT